MTSPLPPIEFEATPLNPPGFGLYAAAALHDQSGPSRLLGGVTLRQINCGGAVGHWAADVCARPDQGADPQIKLASGTHDWTDPFAAAVLYSATVCDPREPINDIRARAEHALRLNEPVEGDKMFTALLAADADQVSLGASASVPLAVGKLESALYQRGITGVIHAPRSYAALVPDLVIRGSGSPVLRTPLGHTWSFGTVPEGKLYATGPAHVWRDEVSLRDALEPWDGDQYALAERTVVVGYECMSIVTTVTP